MLNKIMRVAQPAFAFFLGFILFFWKTVYPILPLDFERILGFTFALITGLIFYFDRRLDALSPRECPLGHMPIGDGVSRALKHVKDPKIIRIFAFSSYMIQAIFKDLRVRVPQCEILLYDSKHLPEPNERDHKSTKGWMPLSTIGAEWFHMLKDGSIGELDIKTHDFYPLSYFILFDDRALLMGHYLIQDQRFPLCETQEPCLILDETADKKLLIIKHLELFRSLHKSKRTSPFDLKVYESS